jgi:hypothetical protein
MAKAKADKRKAKRKSKLKARRQSAVNTVRSEKADFFYSESTWFGGTGNFEKALIYLKKALKLSPSGKEQAVSAVPGDFRDFVFPPSGNENRKQAENPDGGNPNTGILPISVEK